MKAQAKRIENPNASQIEKCSARDCVYNNSSHCRAERICVGEGKMTKCETFMPSLVHVGKSADDGRVGKCEVQSCALNETGECRARKIRIGQLNGQPGCLDYVPKIAW